MDSSLGFFLLTILSLPVPALLVFRFDPRKKALRQYVVFISLWICYSSALSWSGVLASLALPPRVVLMIIAPLLVFVLAVTARHWFREILGRVTDHALIYVQSFRVCVEVLIYMTFLEGLIPQLPTFEGINYDILVGLTALPMGLVVQKGLVGRPVILTWNILSLSVLAVTVGSFVYTFFFSDWVARTGSMGIVEIHIYLPAFLMPMAVFFHICSIRKQFLS